MVLAILILVYRNVVAMLLPLATIGVSLVVAQQAVAGLGELGLGVGPQTIVLMTAMMLGAGTDYAIFLLSRYHECVRSGLRSDDALVAALESIGKVMAGSAGTVAVAFLGMAFTKLGVFSTVGPALAVTIIFGFFASTTLLPALIVLAGRRGWVKPRRDLTGTILATVRHSHRAQAPCASGCQPRHPDRPRGLRDAGEVQLRRSEESAGRCSQQRRFRCS